MIFSYHLGIFPGVVNAYANNYAHQAKEQLVYSLVVHFPVQASSGNAAADAARNHQNQCKQLELGHCPGKEGSEQAGNLTE